MLAPIRQVLGRRSRRLAGVGGIAVAVAAVAGCGSSTSSGDVAKGSGSTLAALAFGKWCGGSDLCTYDAIGSDGGVRQLTDQDVDFAGSDVPLTTPEETSLAQGSGDVAPVGTAAFQFPGLVAAIAVPVTATGIDYDDVRLRFSGPTLAAIFSGEIDRWDDPAIASENSGVELPDSEIKLCVRGDASGTSQVFTSFLALHDPGFARAVGVSALPNWPSGDRVIQNDGTTGVGDCLASTTNAIGYLDLGDAIGFLANGREDPEDVGEISEIGVERNGSIDYVVPDIDSIATAGTVGVEEGAALTTYTDRLVAPDISGAYPISATTYIIARQQYSDGAVCDAVVDTIRFAFSDAGQDLLLESSYAAVPSVVREAALVQIAEITKTSGDPCGDVDESS